HQSPLQRGSGEPVDERVDAVGLLQLRLDRVALCLDRLDLGGRRRADRVVEAGDADARVRVAQAREREQQAPGRAGYGGRDARMRVGGECLDVEAYCQEALEAEPDLGPAVGERAAPLPQAGVRVEQLRVPAHDLVEVRTADLLLALDDPAD